MHRVSRNVWHVFGLVVALTSIRPQTAAAYNPPWGLNQSHEVADMNTLKTHGTIVLKAIDILQADGHGDMYILFKLYQHQLVNGVMQADDLPPNHPNEPSYAADVPLEGTIKFPRNAMAHFYNPTTGKGLALHFGAKQTEVDLMKQFSIGSWEISTALGPHPAATDMADWAYSKAVDAMRKGDVKGAMTQLGWALHFVADCTVPQHATDCSASDPTCNHVEFEDACDGWVAKAGMYATKDGIYHDDWRPGQFVEYAANESRKYIKIAKDPATFKTAAVMTMPLAERLSAGLLSRFYHRWKDEAFAVVVMSITRVQDPTGDIDGGVGPEADFYPKLTIGGTQGDTDKRAYTSGAIYGGDDVQPNKELPFYWFYPRWVDLTPLTHDSPTSALPPTGDGNEAQYGLASPDRAGHAEPRFVDAGPGAASVPAMAASWSGATPSGAGTELFLAATGSATRTSTPVTRPLTRSLISRTKLTVWTQGKPGGEFGEWGTSREMEQPEDAPFAWSSQEPGTAWGRWEVSNSATPSAGASPLASGEVQGGAAGKTFTIDFAKFVSATPPSRGMAPKYYVRVTPLNAQHKPLGASSSSVVITYRVSGKSVVFAPGAFDPQKPALYEPEKIGHPRVTITGYDPPPYGAAESGATGELRMELSNRGTAPTQPVRLLPFDGSQICRVVEGEVPVPSIQPGASMTLKFKLGALLTLNPSQDKYKAWKERYAKNAVRIGVQTTRVSLQANEPSANRAIGHPELVWRAGFPFPYAVPIHLAIWDLDDGLNGDDDHCDVNPAHGKRDLDFTYRFDGRISGNLSAPPASGPSVATSKGAGDDDDGNDADIAAVWVKLENFPRIAPQYSVPYEFKLNLAPKK